MKYLFAHLLIVVLFVSGCQPSETAIQTAIAQTQAANPTSTFTPTKSNTPTKANTPTRTNTPRPKSTSTPRKTPTPNMGTLGNPYPYGTLANLSKTSGGETINLIFQVKKVMRGQEAWSAIYSANRFNDAPPTGMEAIMIELYAKNTSTSGILQFEKYDFSIVSRGRFIDAFDYSPCCLKNAGFLEFEILLAPDGEASGWIASMVSEGDYSPILAVGSDRSGRGGIYFSLASP